jgi:hypothetical protein
MIFHIQRNPHLWKRLFVRSLTNKQTHIHTHNLYRKKKVKNIYLPFIYLIFYLMSKASNKHKVYSSTANCQTKIPAIFREIFGILRAISNFSLLSHGPLFGRRWCEPCEYKTLGDSGNKCPYGYCNHYNYC